MALDGSDMSLRSTIFCLLAGGVLLAGCDRQSPSSGQAEGRTTPPAVAPAKEAHVVDRSHKGEQAPDIRFDAPGAKKRRIADATGKPVLVNLWATWCGPCIGELPTLDALAQTMPVMAIAQDLDPAKVAPFLQSHKAGHLIPYVDPQTSLSIAYQASLPTSILYDAAGKEVWRVTGALDWTSAEAKKLLAEAR
jgi:thiol-disulfide isomerase/thioredoxin